MKDITSYKRELENWKQNVYFYAKEIQSPFFLNLTETKIKCYGIDIVRDKIVVDLGGANGFFLDYLKKFANFSPVTIDFAFDMLKAGRNHFRKHEHSFINASAENVPLKSSSVDIVVLNGALHHFKASGLLKKAVEEINNILKSNGFVCIYDRNGSLVSTTFHFLAICLKKLLQIFIGKFPSSSSDNEPDFNDDDLKFFLDKGYKIQRRMFCSTLPFFLLLVACNFIEYTVGYDAAQIARKVFVPIAIVFERFFQFKFFTVEQCLLLNKN